MPSNNPTMMKNLIIISCLVLSSLTLFGQTNNETVDRPYFNPKKDLLVAQFDSKPDPDDIHAQAALGSMMLHPDLKGVKVFAVSGAIGEQGGMFLDSRKLFNAAFGSRWTAANEDWNGAVEDIVKVVRPILKKGGKVWVQEAGQSNITAAWLKEILKTIPASVVKTNVVVAQHSNWNEDVTTDADLAFVKEMTAYFSLDDGNAMPNDSWNDRGPHTTPCYRAKEAKWMALARESKNKKTRKMWTLADDIIASYYPHGFNETWSYLSTDGVDYSDCCENWWILNIGEKADSHEKFWDRYVMNK